MLRELHISNLAVIEDAAIELREGLNCFTGQTGAGKSLVIGAFELLLGLRSAADLLRAGAEEGRVSGVFELTDASVVRAINALADLDLDEAGRCEQLLITRKLFASGRTSVSINGRPATQAMLREIGTLLVDVHGQHDHQYLLRPGNQLTLLDRFGETEPLRERFGELHATLRELHERRDALTASQTLRRQQLELYEFQAREIDDAEPIEGEYEETAARERLLSNLATVQRDAHAVYGALYESDASVVERLTAIVALLRELADTDEQLKDVSSAADGAVATLQDVAFDLSRYLNRLELDPAELAELTDRINTLNRLIHKYGSSTPAAGGSLDDVLAYRAQIGAEIDRLRGESQDLSSIDQQIAPVHAELTRVGSELSDRRRAAAARLAPLVERQLAELGMAEARFEVSFGYGESESESESAADGAPLPTSPQRGERLDADDPTALPRSSTGFDRVEMLVQANPGQPARPLRKVASGGELSRLMLAIKSIAADADRVCVLVFDEIDANIGGRLGGVIGDKLRRLASHHQVLCITHLPQIAAWADHHCRIVKHVDRGQTHTRVEPLTDRDRRIDELAEMLTGQHATATTRSQATELLLAAESTAPTARRDASPGASATASDQPKSKPRKAGRATRATGRTRPARRKSEKSAA
ncbi:MAG: DNA repair protein RecN [Phycisphaera sp.]|nr:DNA repair protein RecN [Phycisphaera sp.]